MNFLIEYTVFDKNNGIIKSGKIRAKNKDSEIAAKVGLEKYFIKKYKNFGKLIIYSCIQDYGANFDMDTDFGGIFKGIFKK